MTVRAYAGWIDRHRWWVIVASLATALGAAFVAARLEVRADFSYLLPQDARSVTDLRALERRARVLGTVLVVVEAVDHDRRERAAEVLRARISALPDVSSVTFDHQVERRYAWDNRWLFAELADLVAARDTLASELTHARLAASPLFVSLDDAPGPDASARLRERMRAVEAERQSPGELLGERGDLQLVVVHAAFSSGDLERTRALVDAIESIATDLLARDPVMTVGLTGDLVVSLAEHDAILGGMLRATVVTVILVLAALLWFFRSPLAIGALSWSLVVGTLVTFAFARVALGYLNVATAFLSSIVIGNGINVGIVVTARYVEELRAGRDGVDALAGAIERTARATFAAALAASVAYASLVLTVFRGFRHFGLIAGVGILLCWASAYVVLPAALAVSRRLGMRARRPPPLGRWLARLAPRRPRLAIVVLVVLTMIGLTVTTRFLFDDPFESNFRNLRSTSQDIVCAAATSAKIDRAFGQGIDAGFVIGVDRREEVAPLVERLRRLDRWSTPSEALFSRLVTLDDLLPADQPRKLEVLSDIRALLSPRNLDVLDDVARADALRLRPPDHLRALGDDDVPPELASPFIEADGSRGKLILATPGKGFEVWDAHDTVRFSTRVGAIDWPGGARLGGASFVFADVLRAVLADGPRATLAAAAGALLVILLTIGCNPYGVVTIVCGAAGTIAMLALGALLGFKINFLDFVALPITIGIGIEYAVNITGRAREEGSGGARTALASTGGAVVLCSYTTIVGYGSLLLSQNLGIRSFGIAAMLGELACLAIALLFAPALLATVRR